MKRLSSLRAALWAAGALVTSIAMLAETVVAQMTDLHGTINFQGGAAVPKGHVKIYLKDSAVRNSGRLAAATQLQSEGKAKTIDFFLPLPANAIASQTLQIVAQLERGDGWLLARGSATLKAGTPVEITLNTVMY